MGEVGQRGKKDTEIERQQHESGGNQLRKQTCLDNYRVFLILPKSTCIH